MTIGWIDGTAGASGDMLLGAVVDAGVALDRLQSVIDRLDLGIVLRAESVQRAGLGAVKIHVDVPHSHTARHLADIVALLERIDEPIRRRATAVFERLASAEAQVHRTSIDDVHFHEVGALDSIADVVGVCTGFVDLALDALHCSTLSLGSGTTRGAHGPIPVPAPAVLAVLQGIGLVGAGAAPYESTTPTGAALLAEWVDVWGALPGLTIGAVGMGAGTNDTDLVANAIRLVIGQARPESPGGSPGTRDETRDGTGNETLNEMVQIDTNVDDLDPRVWPEAIAATLTAGAVDAWITPIVMKKGRPAHTFSALCPAELVDAVCDVIVGETSTIGLRLHTTSRVVLDRTSSYVEIDGHVIGVKTATRNGVVVNRSIEWDDVVEAARRTGRTSNDVLTEATGIVGSTH